MSSPDRIPAGETKPERERRVFSFFAADASKYAGLTVRDGTINSRESPGPDILCDVVGEGAVAFEMTEILDQRSKQVMATMMSARETLVGHLSTLTISDQLIFQSKFASKEIKVGFRQDKPLRALQAVIPKLYEWLTHAVADDVHSDDVRMPTDLETAIRHVSILSPGPRRWPRKVTLDGHTPSHRALRLLRRENPKWKFVEVRSCKYLNNIVGAPGKVWRFQRVKIPHRQGASHPTGNRALGLWR
jgi:hypothetical protein